jgi:ribosomal protein S18 acetylase RimI-like enzyme
MQIRKMNFEDYDQAIALWKTIEGMGLSSADTPDAIKGFLERNPDSCFVIEEGEGIIATALCGNDGRRGYLYHVAVHPAQRGKGYGKLLVERCLNQLKEAEIGKCHLFVMADNEIGFDFWQRTGWIKRDDIIAMSYSLD